MCLCRSQLEGTRQPRPFSELLEKPELRFHGVQQPYVIPILPSRHTDTGCARGFSDIYVTCQLVADNKPLTIPFRTSFKSFKKEYVYVTSYTHLSSRKLNRTMIGGTSGSLFQSDTATYHSARRLRSQCGI